MGKAFRLRRRIRKVQNINSGRRDDDQWFGAARPEILFIVDPLVGNTDSDVAPKFKRPVLPKQLEFLTEYCKKHEIPLSRCAITRAAPPVTSEMWDSDKKMGDHIKESHEELANNIARGKPQLIVAMGKWAARQVFNKAIKITQIRGTPVENSEFNCLVFPCLGVAHVMRVPEVRNVFESDFETLNKIYNAGYSINYQDDIGKDYKWCTDLTPYIDRADRGEKLLFACDIESVGLQWFRPSTRILTVQLSEEAGSAIAVPIDYNHEDQSEPHDNAPPPRAILRKILIHQLKRLLEHPNVAVFGHNFKFDYIMLWKILGIKCANWIDETQCLMHAVDENILNKSLDDGARLYVPRMAGYADAFNRDPIHEKKTRMDKVPPGKMLMYGCGDVDASFSLRRALLEKLKEDKKAYKCYRTVVMPALRAFAQIEDHGFTVSKKALQEFEIFLRKHQNAEYKRLLKYVPKSIREAELGPEYEKRIRGTNKTIPASLVRPNFLRAMLFTHRDGLRITPRVFTKSTRKLKDPALRVPSTSAKDHLAYFAEDHPFIAGIIDYIKNEKLLGTYVGTEDGDSISGFYKYIFDDRIRPTYNLHRVVTGRTSSSDPNGQNFPKRGKLAKKYREVFVAPDGYVYLEVDFSQLELRIAAILANDPTMLRLYREGADIHTATACAVMGISLEEFNNLPADVRAHRRFQAKAVNFGFLYGMGWRKFITYAKTEYGEDFTEEEAQRIQQTFFRLYSALRPWHNATIEYVREHGFVRSLDGRIRHLPNVFSDDEALAASAERMAINSPVQGFGSDLGLIALARLVADVDFNFVRPIGFIHDALVCLVRKEEAKAAAAYVKNIMETLPLGKMFNLRLPIPIVAEAAIGETLASMIEIKDSWIANDNVTSFEHIRELDWEAAAAKAKANGDLPPPKPWEQKLRKKPFKRKKLAAITKHTGKRTKVRLRNASKTQIQTKDFKIKKLRKAT